MGLSKRTALQVTTLLFWKFCFSLKTSYKELIRCTNDPNPHIRTFCKRWSFIWRCFFPVSILKKTKVTQLKQLSNERSSVIQGQINLIKFVESSKFDNIRDLERIISKIWHAKSGTFLFDQIKNIQSKF